MALIGEMKYLQIGTSVYEIPTSELPIASSSTLGGIKVGTNLSIDSTTGVLSASFTETDPVFGASAAAGITATDITNWNNKVSDDQTWHGVSLTTTEKQSNGVQYIPVFDSKQLSGSAGMLTVTSTPTAYKIAKYDTDAYLKSTTPSASDDSTKVATTAWVTAKGYLTSFTETDPTVPSWAKASTKPTYTASEVGAVATTAVGAASGVAPLNASQKIDSTYLPSYVDDIIEGYYYNNKFWEEAAHTTEITGEAGKIYVDLSTNKTYRYSGSAFVEVSSGSLVTISRNLTSGTKSATINIDGTDYDIYSETNTDTKLKTSIYTPSQLVVFPIFGDSISSSAEEKYISYGFMGKEYNNEFGLFLGAGGSSDTGYLWLNKGNYGTTLYANTSLSTDRTIYLPNADGTIALTSDIPSIPTNISAFTNDAGYITSSDIPVTSVNGQTGAVTVVEDDHKWGGVTLEGTGANTAANAYVPVKDSMGNTSGTAYWATVTSTPTKYCIAKYDAGSYLKSTTPSANDSSTKVATTAFVAGAVSGIAVPTASSTTPAMDGTAATGSETTFARGDHVHPTDTSRAASTAVTTQATIDNTGLITYKNSGNTSLYTVQLPLFDGGSGPSDLPFLPLAGGSLTGNLSVGGTTTSTGLLTASGGISTTTLTTSGNTTVGGTLGVTGAATLNSTLNVSGATTVEGVTVNGVLDVTQRRCSATLSSAGWYRVCKTANVSGSIIKLHIDTVNVAETHEIGFYVSGSVTKFADEVSVCTHVFVDKIRATYSGTDLYIDVHYAQSTANTVKIGFEAYGKASETDVTTSSNLASVADAPSGETVQATYEFVDDVPYYKTDSTGSYQMFSDGTLICWVDVTFSNVAITSSWDGIYESSWLGLGYWPKAFVSMPTISLIQDYSGSSQAAMLEAVRQTSATYVGQACFWRPNSATVTTVKYKIVGIGRWK